MGVRHKEALFHAGVVDKQEYILSGSHVDEKLLAFRAFLVQKLVHRLISGGLEQVGTDNLIKRPAQVG